MEIKGEVAQKRQITITWVVRLIVVLFNPSHNVPGTVLHRLRHTGRDTHLVGVRSHEVHTRCEQGSLFFKEV
jgi:hypothetical protein